MQSGHEAQDLAHDLQHRLELRVAEEAHRMGPGTTGFPDIPQAVVDTSRVPDWYLGPINQGIDKSQRLKVVKLELVKGLNRIMALVESFDRLTSQQAQLEQMSKMSLSPSELKAMLALPQGNAAAVLLVAPTSSMKKHDA